MSNELEGFLYSYVVKVIKYTFKKKDVFKVEKLLL